MNGTSHSFQACLFRPDLGNEVIQGTISVDRSAFRFRSETVTETIPEAEVAVVREGRKGPVYFQDPNRPELIIYTLDTSILEAWSNVPANNVRLQIRELAHRGDFSKALRVTLYVIAGFVLVAGLASWISGLIVQSLASHVPPAWERTFGDEQIEKLREEKRFVNDTNLTAQLSALAQPLLRALPRGTASASFRFHVVESPFPNAFALPGGHIVVTTELLRITDHPDELLGVLAHELAHVEHHDAARTILSAAGPIVIFGVLLHTRSGLMNILSGGSGFVVFQSYSREYESEADSAGWNYLVRANINPHGMIDMFRKLQEFEAKEKMSGFMPEALSSHPTLDKRIARLEARWKRFPRHDDFLQLTNPIPKLPARLDSGKRNARAGPH